MGSVRESRTLEEDVPTQLARACVVSASLCDRPVRADEYQAIQKACLITDQQMPHDLHNLIDWGLQSRKLEDCAESWARILKWYFSVFSRPVRYLPWIMLAAAGVGFVPSPLYFLIEHVRVPTRPAPDEMPTYWAATVFLGLVFRTAFLVFLIAVAYWGLFRAAFPMIYRRTDGEDLSLFDRFADHAVMALGRLGQGKRYRKSKCSEAAADRIRRSVFQILRPTQVIVASILLLIGAMNVGVNFGQFCADWVREALIEESAPVWFANRLHWREKALRLWLACTDTPVRTFAGDADLAPLMDWLKEPVKRRTGENSKQEEMWRDSFSKLISKSNLLLALCAVVPLGLNLLALFRTCSRVPLPTVDISSRLAALPAGRNTKFRDLVEDIRQWRPKPPPDSEGEEIVSVEPSGGPPATERRLSDEVWLISVHTLSNSPALLHDDGIERLRRKLGRPVRLMDARTHAGREAVTRPQGSIGPANTQPTCIVYFVHAPATPTADIRGFITELDRQCPASAKIILLADRLLIPARKRCDHDELWRIAEPSQETTAVVGGVHHVLASLDTRAATDELWNQLAAEIAGIVSPESSAFPGSVQVAKRREERGKRLRKAFEIISETFARARADRSNDFSARLRRLADEASQRVRDCFAKEQSLFDVGAEAAAQFARHSHDYARDVATEAKTTAQVQGHKLLQALEAWLFRAASGLSAFLVLTLLTVFPLALYVAPIAALAWAMYAAARAARVRFMHNPDDSGSDEVPIEERAQQLNAFIAHAVKCACSCYWQDADERQRVCITAAKDWSHGARCDGLPGEAELRECWRKSFPDQGMP